MKTESRLRILAVEDDAVDRMAFERFVRAKKLPYDYTMADSVAAALQLLGTQSFELVLCDFNLGDGTCLDVLEQCRDLPVVVVTGSGDEEKAILAMKRGASDYLVKDPQGRYLTILPSTVDQALEAKRTRDQLKEYQEHLERLVERRTAALRAEIEERKRTNEALRESEERYRALFERSLDCVYLSDFEGRFLDANQAALDLLGYRREDIASLSFSSLLTEDQFPLAFQTLGEVRAQGFQANPTEYRLRRKDGSQVRVETRSSLLYRDGKPFAIQGIARDLTARQRGEDEQRRLQAMLIQAQKMEAVGQLAGGIAHDFNNILTAILMQSELLGGEHGLSREMREGLNDIESEAKRAATLTRQLLMFSRRQVLQTRTFDLNSLLGNLLKMLRRLIGEQIFLEFGGVSGSLWITADPGMIEQVVVNLVVNARDALPRAGRITLTTLSLELGERGRPLNPEARPGHFAGLVVSDTGCGMEQATLSHIFEPFFTTKEAGKGTGLGLATVYGIVKQHQGWIEVESQPEQGTTFRVYLPSSSEASIHEVTQPKTGQVPRGSETILLVEDAQSLRHVTASTLRGLGYRVVEAGNSQEALALWPGERACVSLLLADMVMPGELSGQELAHRLHRDKPSLKTLLMSGYSGELVDRGGVAGQEIAFLAKPFDPATLAERIRLCLDGGAGSPR